MNTTKINDIKMSEVMDTLFAIAKVEAIYCNSQLIRTDMRYAVEKVNEFDEYDCKGDYYIAIRENGVENSDSKKYIENRLAILGKAHVAIKITRKENGLFDMTINKAA